MKNYLLLLFVFSALHTSKAQTALSFDGIDDYIVTNNPGPVGTSNRTVECWVKTSNLATSQKVLVDWGNATPLGSRFTLNMLAGGKLRIEVGGNGFNSTALINDGLWHHVAVTYNHQATTKASLFIDGILDISSNFTQAVNTLSTNPILIGRRVDMTNYFEGVIDEVRIWNVARSQSQIAGDMNVSFCNIPSNLVAYYKLNDGIPNAINTPNSIALDFSNTINHGSLINFTLNGTQSNWVTGNVSVQSELNDSIVQLGNSLVAMDTTADSYQWFNCTNLSFNVNDTNKFFFPPSSDSYALSIRKGQCSDTSNCINFISTKIEENSLSDTYLFLNNSSTDIVKVKVSNSNLKSEFSLYQINGILINREILKGDGEITFRNITKAGVYILQILNENGSSTSYKFIKN